MFSGIGPKREEAIRAAGILGWRQFLDARDVPGLTEKLYHSVAGQIREWSSALERGDAGFLSRNVPRSGQWALFEEFGDSLRYLDIETTGLSPGYHDVTVVGIYDGRHYQGLIRGQGLNALSIQHALEGCKLLITYYGSAFDIPFLRSAFPEVRWDLPHFDLCFAGRRVGLKGGLKAVEAVLGIGRDDGILDIDGFEAVRLWRAYQKGDSSALTRLVEYNEADTRNLAGIAPIVYDRLCRMQRHA